MTELGGDISIDKNKRIIHKTAADVRRLGRLGGTIKITSLRIYKKSRRDIRKRQDKERQLQHSNKKQRIKQRTLNGNNNDNASSNNTPTQSTTNNTPSTTTSSTTLNDDGSADTPSQITNNNNNNNRSSSTTAPPRSSIRILNNNNSKQPPTPFNPANINDATHPPSTQQCGCCDDNRSRFQDDMQQHQSPNKYKSVHLHTNIFSPETNELVNKLHQNQDLHRLIQKMGGKTMEENNFITQAMVDSSSLNPSRNLGATFERSTTASTSSTTIAPLQQPTYNNERIDMSSTTNNYPPMDMKAFHYYKPDKGEPRGQPRAPGKHNIKIVAKHASKRAKKKVVNALLNAGGWEQQRETLYNLIIDPQFRDMYRSLSGVDGEEARVGCHVLKSIKKVMSKVMATQNKNFKQTNKQRRFIRCLSILVSSIPTKSSGITERMLGRFLGFSTGAAHRNFKKGRQKAALIMVGDEEGYELIEEEKDRSKYSAEELKRFDNWILNECEVVVDNPCKDDGPEGRQ